MTDPLPNCRSICPRATSSASSRFIVVPPRIVRPRHARCVRVLPSSRSVGRNACSCSLAAQPHSACPSDRTRQCGRRCAGSVPTSCQLCVRSARARWRPATAARARIHSRSPGSTKLRADAPVANCVQVHRGRPASHRYRRWARRCPSRRPQCLLRAWRAHPPPWRLQPSADTAPCAAIRAAGTPSAASFTSLAYATTPPTNTSLARHIGEPARDHPTRARLGSCEGKAACTACLDHELLNGPLVVTEQVLFQCALEGVGDRVGTAFRTWRDDVIDVDLELARADRDLDAVAVPGFVKRLGHRRLAHAVEALNVTRRRHRAFEDGAHLSGLEHPRPESL